MDLVLDGVAACPAHGPPGLISRPERHAAVTAQGDEVLDCRAMTGRYPVARIRLLEGSDHALSDFDAHLPVVVRHRHPSARFRPFLQRQRRCIRHTCK